jgi:ubiquinone biosynthesis protein UbiJ
MLIHEHAANCDMAIQKTIQELNRELADKLSEEGRNNPASVYAGKFVGIANGQVVVVADDWDELACRLHQVEPDPTKTFGVEVGRDYEVVEEIWTIR